MGQPLNDRIDILMRECAECGVVFSRPSEGRLRPILTRGKPPAGLLERVKAEKEAVAARVESLFAAVDAMRDDAAGECAERAGACLEPDACPWFHECGLRGAQHANKR